MGTSSLPNMAVTRGAVDGCLITFAVGCETVDMVCKELKRLRLIRCTNPRPRFSPKSRVHNQCYMIRILSSLEDSTDQNKQGSRAQPDCGIFVRALPHFGGIQVLTLGLRL